MKKKKTYAPDYLAKKATDIPVSFYHERGIKAVLCDLDNTLAPYTESSPNNEVRAYVAGLQEAGIAFYIASNNSGKRVKAYALDLGVESCHALFKPAAYFLKRFLRKKGLAAKDCAMVGDQCATDIKSGNRAGCLTILVDHLSEYRPLVSKINGLLDNRYRKMVHKHRLSKEWDEE